jgi:hypothetical protein
MKLLYLPITIFIYGTVIFLSRKKYNSATVMWHLTLFFSLLITIFCKFSLTSENKVFDSISTIVYAAIPTLISYLVDYLVCRSIGIDNYIRYVCLYTVFTSVIITFCMLIIVSLFSVS